MKTKLIISCEHAVNTIPTNYQYLFAGNTDALKSHRGYDLGALELYLTLVQKLKPAYSSQGNTSRLLVELNRSLHHKNLFSEFTKSLTKVEKEEVITTHYLPYRSNLENIISSYIKNGFKVFHLSIHSFTPVLNGNKRNADFGLLYDPKNKIEFQFSRQLKKELNHHLPHFRVRFNYPYLGTADGFTTHLRKKFPSHYAGIEIELNNSYSKASNFDEIQLEIAIALNFALSRKE